MFSITSEQRIAYLMSPRMGDSLIDMLLVYHAVQQGYKISVFSDFLYHLRHWFPWVTIEPYPSNQHLKEKLMQFEVSLHTYSHDNLADEHLWHPCVYYLDHDSCYTTDKNLVDINMQLALKLFGGERVQRSNGIMPLSHISAHINPKQLIIHPTASEQERYMWPRFAIKLASRLTKAGWQIIFITTTTEVPLTQWIERAGYQRFVPGSLNEVAIKIYESGGFIGADSGLSHLASSLGLPTITLHQRRKKRIRWRPGFSANIALIPHVNLIYKPIKERYWKYLISVRRVLHAFNQLQYHQYIIQKDKTESAMPVEATID